MNFFCQNLTNDFYTTKVAKFYESDKIMQMLLQLQEMVYKMISSVVNLAVFCFWNNVELIVLFAVQLNDPCDDDMRVNHSDITVSARK